MGGVSVGCPERDASFVIPLKEEKEIWWGSQQVRPKHGKTNIMTTADFFILTGPSESDYGLKGDRQVAAGRRGFSRSEAETEPETRLWKVCAKAASSRLSGAEWIALLFFGASALGALASCFSELFHLFNSGALDQIVRALLTG